MPELEILPELRGKDVTDLGDATPEELRGKRPEELEQFLQVLDAHLRSLHQDEDSGELRDKSPDEQKAFTYGLKLRDKVVARIDEHRAVQEVFTRAWEEGGSLDAVAAAEWALRLWGESEWAPM